VLLDGFVELGEDGINGAAAKPYGLPTPEVIDRGYGHNKLLCLLKYADGVAELTEGQVLQRFVGGGVKSLGLNGLAPLPGDL